MQRLKQRTMKKILIGFFTLVITALAWGQTPGQPIHAEFRYNQQSFQQAIQSNSILLTLSDLPDEGPSMDYLTKTINWYKDIYTLTIGPLKSNGERDCEIRFVKNNVRVGVLSRLFVANNISELLFDGTKLKSEQFFSNY